VCLVSACPSGASLCAETILGRSFLTPKPVPGESAFASPRQVVIRPRILSVERRKPTALDLRVLRRLTWTEADPIAQCDKLHFAYAVADWSEEFFNNRALFSDYYLAHRLPEWMPPRDCSSFRLDGAGFFFKFCPSVVLEPLSADLIKGIYLPRQYLETLLRSEVTDGMRGGKVITFENVRRHLTYTEFAWLVREGWLGTREISTRAITDVIAGALDAERAVIHARSFAAS